MWVSTKEKLDGSIVFFQFTVENELCIFNFTNMKNFYAKEIHKSLITSIYAPNNQVVEVEAENLIEYLNSIQETSSINYEFYPGELNIKTNMIITLTEGYPPFKLELELESKNFYLNITSPLLKLIVLLKKSQEELINIIEKKDLEISECILEGCNITHENIKTETFDKNNFLTDIFEKNKDLCNEGPNLYELYTSPLIEQFNNRDINEYKTLDDSPLKIGSEDLKKPLKKKYIPLTSTTMEISHKSINVKKKKSSSLLKNL